ncbi:carbon-nitrogen hydrolase family protein [Methanocella arvoryzae]|uniref:Amidohydrolase n=1 Tax=Methanocella arvoryzae (strain DSM 22066 / NBRC 105507 / MRE50) TaxID=351160 RepID=Q0W654_METAR|nr:carbon-nitrogen hydrolase family protein [Methanocella arvoryzae]CAJ36139.1 putative amidohydrolase [Methanocella arvoryzae MRE50]
MSENIRAGTNRLRVAAVQMRSEIGERESNLKRATPLIEKAAREGAQLVVLPEMAASGYSIENSMWIAAEPVDGPTVQWLKETAKRLGIYLGIGVEEAEGEDFYNTYVLASPDGRIAGKVRKVHTEYNIFKPGEGSRIIDTEIGRIGIGICADNHYIDMPLEMQEKSIDLLLMPHAWPIPFKAAGVVKEEDVREQQENVKGYSQLFARMLGVPSVFVNAVGPIGPKRWEGILGRLIDPAVYRNAGYSSISDSDGSLLARLGPEEDGVIVADVTLDLTRKLKTAPVSYGGWLHPGDPLLRKVVMPAEICIAKLKYAVRPGRKAKARAVSRGR